MGNETSVRALNNEAEKFVDKLCKSASSSGAISGADNARLEALVEEYQGYYSNYDSDFPAFGEVDEFPWQGLFFPDLVQYCRDYEPFEPYDDWSFFEQAKELISSQLNDEYQVFFHVRALHSYSRESAWLIVSSFGGGQSGIEENIVALTKTKIEAEEWLRRKGYFFLGETPSGSEPVSKDTLAKMLLNELSLELDLGIEERQNAPHKLNNPPTQAS